jgi:PAS domain S-box-containing protein
METPMPTIPGYQITQELYASTNSLIYRARRMADDRPVILKLLNQDFPTPERVAWFTREYDVLSSLRISGVVAAYSLEYTQQRPVMVLEDFGGDSLHRLRVAGKLDLADALRLAIDVADTLGQVHQRYIMHKDINPSNIVLNPTTGQVKLIDFGISTVLSREMPAFRNPNVLEGTLAYISPEQTGRMNRDIDYRTDYYSFGVTFYELLTGRLPFASDDPLELIHSHIARLPPAPQSSAAGLPPTVSAILLKLLAKNAEDRYQSAHGIVADLSECLRQWQAHGQIEPFALGRADRSDRLYIPQKLYGRERETAGLLAAFEHVSDGASELLLVAGYAGVGKSALVHELYKPMSARRAYFIAGKFDQLQRNIPYSAFIQALRLLMQQLLTENAAAIATWRDKLLAALGPNGQVIVDVIPEVELIIQPQPAPARLDAAEAQQRFRLVFQSFIKVFARPAHVLVIFLDDLQWADAASLELLQALMTASDRNSMLVLGAYRDNEISDTHPLMRTLAEIADAGATVHQITLAPLDLDHTAELLVDTLRHSRETVLPLAELLQRKTEGNPFFVNEFLKSLYVAGLLMYTYPTDEATHAGHWQWDLAQIQERGITDNVIELLTGKVRTLSPSTQHLLQLAACIGNQFDLATLAVVSEQRLPVVAADLWSAVAEGLLVPIGDAYKLVGSLPEGALLPDIGEQARYHFAHDRVQQAVYLLIPSEDRDAIHWRVGQLMLRNTAPKQREAQIFALVTQLNHGVALLATQAERDELAELNLLAARKAKLSAAYQPAFVYAQVGCQLLDDAVWRRRYDLALELYTEAAETAYLSGDEASLAQSVAVVLHQARTLLDKVKVYEVLIRANHALEAAPVAFDVLQQLGITFPEQPSQEDMRHALAEIQELQAGRPIADLIDLPRMTDPVTLAALHIMSTASTAVYSVAPRVFPLYVFKQVALSIAYGSAPQSTFSYALYGLILCGMLGELDAGYQWGQLGMRLLDTLDATQFRAKTSFIVQAFINHWNLHVDDTLMLGRAAYQSGLETGDIEFVGLASVAYSAYAYHSGKPLLQLEREIASYVETIAALKHETSVYRLQIYQQASLNMLGRANDPCQLHGDVYDVGRMLPVHIERSDGSSAFAVYLNQLILCYLFQRHAEAIQSADRAEASVDLVVGQMLVPIFYFYDSLARLAIYADAAKEQRAQILEKVGANQAKLQRWAAHAPMNYLHKWCLVEAERARVLDRSGEAREQYDQAIALAQRHRYLNEEALAHELAGRFYFDKGLTQFAEVCVHNARYAYQRWGALAKVSDIETGYPHMFAQAKAGDTAWISTGSGTTTGHTTGRALDVTSVVKASQAISSQIVLDRLLHTLMKIAIENAGAQQGYLLLPKQDSFSIAAIGSVDQTNAVVLQSPPIATLSESAEPFLPLAIINYVARTHESIVLNDAAAAGQFTQDAYIARTQPRSVLCAPLLNGGRLTGILYLENNLTTGAFTPDRLEVLKLLAAQTAISIENASLYAHVEQSERKYRALFEDSHDTIFITGRAGEILDINPAGVRMFGYPKAELLRLHTVDLYVDPDDRQRLVTAMEIDGAVHDFETTLRAADGTLIDCLITATVRSAEDGTSLGFQGIIRDVTERRRTQREREQLLALQRELDVARHIQSSLLPSARIAWPNVDGVCYNAPAREVSGDFYTYGTLSLSQGRRFVALGDVTGKGMPAALLMAISMSSFQAIIPQSRDPSDLLRRLDQAIARYTRTTRQNCALTYVDIALTDTHHPSDRAIMHTANAGGVPPLIRRAGGAVEWIDARGLPLGIELGAELGHTTTVCHLGAGDMVILTSDGVIEAMRPTGELFGFARLEQAAASGPDTSAEAMLEHLRTTVDTFAAGDESHDDVTIVILRV